MDSAGNEHLDLDVVEQMIRDRAPIAFKSIGQLVSELRQLRAFVEKTAEIAAASADAANRAREEARLWRALAQARAEHSTADPVAARMALRAIGIDPDALHHGDP